MERLISVKKDYASLDKIEAFINDETDYQASQEYDNWEMRTDSNGQMEKCVVLKKSNMHGAKLYFTQENTLKVNYLIPNRTMNAFFGPNQQAYKGIREIVTDAIKKVALSGSQKKAFSEIVQVFDKIAV